jgi:F-type H+-transporting ATPase subunit a
MSLALFLWQEASHAEGTAKVAEKAAEKGGEEIPAIVEWANHIFGGLVYNIQSAIMPKIQPGWHGDPAHAIPTHMVMMVISLLLCTLVLYLFRGTLSVDKPSNRQQVLEGVILQVRELLDQIVGPYGRKYLPVIGAFTFFILISNLMGNIPGLAAPTINPNVTWALGIVSFVYYISMGFKQQGIGYLKHFTGGLSGWLSIFGLIIFVVEIISNSLRPFTLGLRLFVNIFADEQVAGAFFGLVPYVVPSVLLVLAVFVAFVQTFIFVVLSIVYLSETVPHDDHDGHEHSEHGEHGEHAHAAAH